MEQLKVFLLIGTLVLIFLIWQLVFNDGGIVKTIYNSFANGVNKQWEKVAGGGEKITSLEMTKQQLVMVKVSILKLKTK